MVNWNGGATAVQSARSIVEQNVDLVLRVVDNASTDGSADAIEQACPGVQMIRNDRNYGFATGNNQALAEPIEAEYILLVNNDIIFPDRDALSHVLAVMDADPKIPGACGRYEYPDGRFQRNYNRLPTARDMIACWGIGRHVSLLRETRRTEDFFLLHQDFAQATTIEQPAFSCVLMRAQCASAVGLLDEQFHIFFNDVDYCWRWRQQGWSWRYFPEWRVIHHHSKSTAKMGGLREAEFASSAIRFARKHFSRATAALVGGAIVLEALWRKLRHRDVPVSLSAIWRGELFFAAPPAPTRRAG